MGMGRSLGRLAEFRWHNILRVTALALLAVSIFGPWGFSSDGVPPPEWCNEPNFLLESSRWAGQHCVRLLPGTEIVSVWGQFILSIPVQLVTGEMFRPGIGREFLFVLLIGLLGLPFASTLLVRIAGESRSVRIVHAVGWALALIPVLLATLTQTELSPLQMWGAWLFMSTAFCALVLEGWKLGVRSSRE